MAINREFLRVANIDPAVKAAIHLLLDDYDNASLLGAGVTASSAELNIMDGATLSTSELNKLDGVTATTAELNLVDGIPTVDPADGVTVWNDGGVLKVAS